MHPLNQRVEQAFAAWQEKRQALQETNRALDVALDAFAQGCGADPIGLKRDAERQRLECATLFAEVLAAVRAATLAGVR